MISKTIYYYFYNIFFFIKNNYLFCDGSQIIVTLFNNSDVIHF